MTAETPKGRTGAKDAAGLAEKKKVRRVRVIEVIDGEDDEDVEPDVEEILQKIDEEEAEAAAEEEGDEQEEDEARAPSRVRAALASPRLTATLVVVLVAALATLAIWQWRTAAGLDSEKKARRAVARIAADYGNAVFNYNAAAARDSINKNLALLGGDARTRYEQTTAKNLPGFFAQNPQWTLTSKTKKVFVGEVNGEIATAVILMDVNVQAPSGRTDAPNTLLRVGLAKIDGSWKITEQRSSGQSDQATGNEQQNQIPGLPTTPAPSPSKKKSGN